MLRRFRRDDSGLVAIITAVSALVLMAFGAIAVDLGNAWARKRTVQTTADLAALAGASALPESIREARKRAIYYLKRNLAQGGTLGPCEVTSGTNPCWDNNDDYQDGEIDFFTSSLNSEGRYDEPTVADNEAEAIRVVTPGHRVDFGLAAAVGFSSLDVSAPATASVGSALGLGVPPLYLVAADNGTTCIKDDSLGQSSNPSVLPRWAVRAGHTVSTITPTSGSPGTTVTISGTNLPSTGTAQFGSGSNKGDGTVTNRSSTAWTVNVPGGVTGSVNVTIKNGGDSVTSQSTFTYAPAPASPTLTSLTPELGEVGSTVVINGTDLPTGPQWDAFFNNTQATVVGSRSTAQWRVTVPVGLSGPTAVSLRRTTGASGSSNSLTFTVTAAPPVAAPVLESIDPVNGPVDTVATIRGTGLPTTGGIATFGGVSATVTSRSSATWVVRVPASLLPGDYDVIVNNGTASNALTFTVTAAGDPCFGAASNRGYIDEPRFDANDRTVERNIKKGIDHNLHIYTDWPAPGGRVDPATSVECDALDNPVGTIQKSGANSPLSDVNCLLLKPGGRIGALKSGFFDDSGSTPGGLGRLKANFCSSPGSSGSETNVDVTPLAQFIDTSKGSYEAFKTHVAANPDGISAAPSTQSWVTGDILKCPRFAVLPVLNSNVEPPQGGGNYYPIVGFKAVYFWDDTPDEGFVWGSPGNLEAVRAFVFDLDYLPSEVSGQVAGQVGPYTGSGPKVVRLVHDFGDPPT